MAECNQLECGRGYSEIYHSKRPTNSDAIECTSGKTHSGVVQLTVSYHGRDYHLLAEKRFKQELREHIVIDKISHPSLSVWPGLSNVNLSQYLIAYLVQDTANPRNFREFEDWFRGQNSESVFVSFQDSSSLDLIYCVSYKTNTLLGIRQPGNGQSLGLHVIPHSLAYMKLNMTRKDNRTGNKIYDCDQKTRAKQHEIARTKEIYEEFRSSYSELQENFDSLNRETQKQTDSLNMQAMQLYTEKQLNEELQESGREQETARAKLIETNFEQLKQVRKTHASEIAQKNKKINQLKQEIQDLQVRDKTLNGELLTNEQAAHSTQEELQQLRAYSGKQVQVLAIAEEQLVRVERKLVKVSEATDSSGRVVHSLSRNESILCLICSSNPRNTMCYPCGHVMYCNVCLSLQGIEIAKNIPKAHSLAICGFCRTNVKKLLKCYAY